MTASYLTEIAVILPGDGDQIKQSQDIILYCTFSGEPLSIQKPLPSVGLKKSPLECASVVQGPSATWVRKKQREQNRQLRTVFDDTW